jgi:hypothetical protein
VEEATRASASPATRETRTSPADAKVINLHKLFKTYQWIINLPNLLKPYCYSEESVLQYATSPE